MIFLGFMLIAIAIIAGLSLAPEHIDNEDFYADAATHIDDMDNITLDYYKGWMDALHYYQHFIEENNMENETDVD